MTIKNIPDKPYHHGDLRQQLIDQAALMIREEGEAALSMRKLAARVGVSRTAPYHHFDDKFALLCAIAEEGFQRFQLLTGDEAIEDGMIARSSVEKFVFGYVLFAQEHAEYYDLMFGSHLWKNEKPSDTLKAVSRASFRRYVEGVRHWKEQGWILQTVDPLRYAQVSWSTLHGLSRLLIDGIYVDKVAIEPICQNAAMMFWHELTGLT